MKIAANLSMLFTELPLRERVLAAMRAGFDGVEIQFPYELPAIALKEALELSGLPLVLINVPAGDLMTGGPGLASVPARQAEFDAALQEALTYAAMVRPACINVLPGRLAEGVSREQALEEFQQLSGLGEALKELPENPLPGVILVTPDEVDKDKLEALRQQLAELPGVQQAQLDLLWVERLTAILKLGDRFVFGLTLLLVATLLLVIGNTIRLHIENRRTEIEVVKLVGGTDGYVRRPFLYMGAIYGLGAGLIAWLLLAYGLGWLNEAVVNLAGLYGSDFGLEGVPAGDALSLVIGAVLLGYIGAWLAVARHLSELAPR